MLVDPAPVLDADRDGLWQLVAMFSERWPHRPGKRHLTARQAREALAEVAELVATIGLRLPVERGYLIDPVLDAIEKVAGRECDALEARAWQEVSR